jgi:SET domain-containing protein
MSESLTHKPFIHPSIEIRWDERIYGWGVFAKESIEQHTLVETTPVVVYPQDILQLAAWNTQGDKHKLASLGLTLYSMSWSEDTAIIPLGWGGIYNHSDNNNCQFLIDKENGLLHIATLKDIHENEQLLVSYGEDWFENKPFPKINL